MVGKDSLIMLGGPLLLLLAMEERERAKAVTALCIMQVHSDVRRLK